MIATTRAVAPSSVVSMAPKTAMRSVSSPAGPVALICRSGYAVAASRTDSVTARSASRPSPRRSVALSPSRGMLTSSAAPSWDGIGTMGSGAR